MSTAKAKHVDLASLDLNEKNYKSKTILGMEVAYRDEGKGIPVICLPPWPTASSSFLPFIHAVEKYCRVIALDMPGFSGRSSSMVLPHTVEDYAHIAEEFINSFGFDKYVLLGYSIGGLIAEAVIKRGNVNPTKVIYISSLHAGDMIKDLHENELNLYDFVRNKLHVSYEVLEEFVAPVFINSLFSKEKYYSGFDKTTYFKQFVQENLHNSECIMDILFSIADGDWLNPNMRKFPSIVVLAENDEPFIKRDSFDMAQYLGIKPIMIADCDHNHFTLDVNLGSEIVLEFILNKKKSFFDSIKDQVLNVIYSGYTKKA